MLAVPTVLRLHLTPLSWEQEGSEVPQICGTGLKSQIIEQWDTGQSHGLSLFCRAFPCTFSATLQFVL